MTITIEKLQEMGLTRACEGGHSGLDDVYEPGFYSGCSRCWLATVEAVVRFCDEREAIHCATVDGQNCLLMPFGLEAKP